MANGPKADSGFILVLIAGMLAILLIFAMVAIVSAQEHKNWFNAQRNCKNEYCCSVADGRAYYNGYTPNADGSVTLHDEKHSYVNACLVLHGANPTGHAIIWERPDGSIRCFALGTGS